MSDFPLPEPVGTEPVTAQALDIQHDTDPADEHGNARRIPHMGHAALFFALMGALIVLCSVVLVVALTMKGEPPTAMMKHPAALIGSQLAAYVLTFAIAFPVFPMLWKRTFLDGVSWAWRAARLRWWHLLLLGVALSVAAQGLEFLFKSKATSDISELLKTQGAAWLTVFFGIAVAPVTEEVAFRGFLLPALATAYDWLSLERTPAALEIWRTTTKNSRGALVFAAVFSSLAFTALHGSQLHWARAPLAILMLMSLAFSAVRIYTRSVAASTLVHVAYDALIFIEVIWATGGFRHVDKL